MNKVWVLEECLIKGQSVHTNRSVRFGFGGSTVLLGAAHIIFSMNNALPTDILNFFAKYKEYFNQLDGVAVASLYRIPSVIVDDASYTIWDTYEKIENNMVALCEIYKQHKFQQTDFQTNQFILQNENFAIVDMRWTITHTDSSPPNVFNTTYNIQKIDGEWKVNLVTAYSEKRLKKID